MMLALSFTPLLSDEEMALPLSSNVLSGFPGLLGLIPLQGQDKRSFFA